MSYAEDTNNKKIDAVSRQRYLEEKRKHERWQLVYKIVTELRELNPELAEIYIRHEQNEQSFREIGDAMGLTKAQVSYRYYRAAKIVKEKRKKYE